MKAGEGTRKGAVRALSIQQQIAALTESLLSELDRVCAEHKQRLLEIRAACPHEPSDMKHEGEFYCKVCGATVGQSCKRATLF